VFVLKVNIRKRLSAVVADDKSGPISNRRFVMDENRVEGTARKYGGRVQEGVGR
jgi:hypothetical protein